VIQIESVTRFRGTREQLKRFEGLSPEGQGQNLALTAVHVPLYGLDSGKLNRIK
jgi:hypothetical protein